jgi:glycosyltransferase involved in cell wall biosynthesis
MKKLAISVIIVVLNGEKYLKSAIDSVINQSHQPDEIIVVDGNSTDETAVIAKSFMQVTYIKQSGTGLANARNNGIDFATGDLIAFLDSDDLWTENKLKIQLEHFTNDPEIEYSYGRLKLFIKPGGTEPRTGYTPSSFLVLPGH